MNTLLKHKYLRASPMYQPNKSEAFYLTLNNIKGIKLLIIKIKPYLKRKE